MSFLNIYGDRSYRKTVGGIANELNHISTTIVELKAHPQITENNHRSLDAVQSKLTDCVQILKEVHNS